MRGGPGGCSSSTGSRTRRSPTPTSAPAALRDRFDVIVLPDQAPRRIVAGHQPTDRPREGPWGPVPPEYQGGIGEAGVEALKMFVQAGGRLHHV